MNAVKVAYKAGFDQPLAVSGSRSEHTSDSTHTLVCRMIADGFLRGGEGKLPHH